MYLYSKCTLSCTSTLYSTCTALRYSYVHVLSTLMYMYSVLLCTCTQYSHVHVLSTLMYMYSVLSCTQYSHVHVLSALMYMYSVLSYTCTQYSHVHVLSTLMYSVLLCTYVIYPLLCTCTYRLIILFPC